MTNNPPTGTTPTTVVDPTTIGQSTDATKANTDAIKANQDQMTALTGSIDASRNVLSLFTGGIISGTGAFQDLSDTVKGFMNDLGSATDLTTAQMTKFGIAVTAAFGATKSTFGTASFEGLNTFGSQLDALIAPIQDNKELLGMLAGQIGIALPDSVKKSAAAIADFIKNTATSADNAVKLEDVYVKAAAATGRLGDVHATVGTSLEHINNLIRDQRSAINQTIIATNLSRDTVESYYNQIQRLPVAMKDGITQEEAMRATTDQLTRTIQVARGTGREFKDVLADMRTAIVDYNASVPEAMKFTAQISEISQNYNIELEDVRKSLTGTADAFKMFGNEAQGAAEILNQYVGSLKATGLSGAVASDIVSNMTKQIGNLSIAQKAFISSQGGGPGGLMGAYNIDMMLRNNKLYEVFNMVKGQMTKMMGPNLVSTEEAARSPAAAAQMTKQIMMLQQGPLGQFARTPAEAERIIDALKSGRTADVKPLLEGQSAVEDATKLGNQYAEQTASGISRIVAMMEEARGEASGANLNLLQSGFTAAAGTEFENQNLASVQTRQAQLRDTMAEGSRRITQPASGIRVLSDAMSTIQDLPEELRSIAEGIGNIMSPEGAKQRETFAFAYAQESQAEREQAMATPDKTEKDAALKKLDQRDAAVNNMLSRLNEEAAGSQGIPASLQLESVAAANARRGSAATASAAGAAPIRPPAATAGSDMGEITVKVEGYCLECGEKMRGYQHRVSVNPATK